METRGQRRQSAEKCGKAVASGDSVKELPKAACRARERSRRVVQIQSGEKACKQANDNICSLMFTFISFAFTVLLLLLRLLLLLLPAIRFTPTLYGNVEEKLPFLLL